MRTRGLKTIAVVALAGVAIAGAARLHAQGGDHGRRGAFGRGFGGPGGVGFGLRGLGLTDEQRTQVKAIVEQHRGELRTARQRVGSAYKAQHAAVIAVPVDEGLIRAKSAELATAQTEAAIAQARVHSEMYQLLTPEQQAKAKELQAQRQARREGMRRRFHERRQQQPEQKQPQQQ